jgi:hypothetical protein
MLLVRGLKISMTHTFGKLCPLFSSSFHPFNFFPQFFGQLGNFAIIWISKTILYQYTTNYSVQVYFIQKKSNDFLDSKVAL